MIIIDSNTAQIIVNQIAVSVQRFCLLRNDCKDFATQAQYQEKIDELNDIRNEMQKAINEHRKKEKMKILIAEA